MMNKDSVHSSYLRTSEAIDLLVIVLSITLSYMLPLPWPGPQSFWLNLVCGAALLAMGIWLIVRCKQELSSKGQESKPGFATTTLVTSGVFARTRNPIYLANLIIYGAVGILFRTLWPILLIPLAMVIFYYWMIMPEERFLAEKFPEDYPEYCARVGRWWTA